MQHMHGGDKCIKQKLLSLAEWDLVCAFMIQNYEMELKINYKYKAL